MSLHISFFFFYEAQMQEYLQSDDWRWRRWQCHAGSTPLPDHILRILPAETKGLTDRLKGLTDRLINLVDRIREQKRLKSNPQQGRIEMEGDTA